MLKDFDDRARQGFFWVSLGYLIIFLVQFGSRIILVRILSPADFGLMNMALIVITFLILVNEFGLPATLIYRKNNIDKAADATFIISLLLGILIFTLIFFLSPFIASFFKEEGLTVVLRLLAFTIIISSLSFVPAGLLLKEMQFKKKFFPEVMSVIAYAVVSIGMALAGFGIMSLVWGYIASTFVNLCLLWYLCHFRPKFSFDYRIASEMLGYGKFVLGYGILTFLLLQIDNFSVGKWLGATLLGYYSVAFMLANLTTTNVTHLISKVVYPLFTKSQDETEMAEAYVKTVRINYFLILPVLSGLALLPNEIVRIIFGEKWLPMAGVLSLLCLAAFFRSFYILSETFLVASGRAKVSTKIRLGTLFLLSIIIYPFTIRMGILGTGLAITFIMLLMDIFVLQAVSSGRRTVKKEMLLSVRPFLIASFIMAVVIFTIRHLPFWQMNLFDLFILIFIGIVVYLAMVYSLDKKIWEELKINNYFSTRVHFIDLIKSKNRTSPDKLNLGWCAVFPPTQNGAASVTYYFVNKLLKRNDINLFAIPIGKRIDKVLFPGIKFASLNDSFLDAIIFWCMGTSLVDVKTKAKRIIWQTVHDPLGQVMERKLFYQIKSLSPDLVITLSEWSKVEYERNGFKKVTCIPAGVARNIFKPNKNKTNFKVLFVSRTNYFKGIFPFLESIPLVLDKYPKVKFSLHAPFDKNSIHVKEIEHLIKTTKENYPDNFEYGLSWVDYYSVSKKYQDANLLVFPSNCEGFGVPLIEAMACGLPCIVAEKLPMSEIIRDNYTGFCIPFRPEVKNRYEALIKNGSYHYEGYRDWLFIHPEDIADKINYLIENPQEYKRLSENAIEEAEKYDLDTCVENMVSCVKDIPK